jgi:hypothetical protein
MRAETVEKAGCPVYLYCQKDWTMVHVVRVSDGANLAFLVEDCIPATRPECTGEDIYAAMELARQRPELNWLLGDLEDLI